ncbi:hypothetical protein BCR39DRAFT_543153 [Naematelia encephala]|uniref:Eukaryotic translation initiation factor 5B n=1 Tax=Naematelia encephala TaxID=71784 RepID=A0A1Y2AU41_9TREE|nr:hypothetical protein BCR39DRAFT_543153 [Naematelia encephala]
MPPKGKGKKGKKGGVDDDDIWADKEPALGVQTQPLDVSEEPSRPQSAANGAAGFSDDEDEDGGGLMAMINASKKKDKKAKKGKSGAAEVSAEAEATEAPPADKVEDEGEEDDDGPKVLTKAQKEKLKKEREKAKKKAQADAKKKAAAPEPTSTTAAEAEPEAAAKSDGEDEEGGGADDKKKKKKKKPAAKAPEPAAAAKGKKIPAHIAALQAAMLEKQKLEEEAKQAEAERQRLLEEEDARIAAEEQRIADQKAAKKAKEKEKLAKAKAEGRLLTPAQKRERAAAEARKQALLAAGGVVVAGLQGGAADRKKPSYGKKKPGKAQNKDTAPSGQASTSTTVDSQLPDAPAAEAEAVDADDWDVDGTTEVDKVTASVDQLKVESDGDDWDASDNEVTVEPAPEPKSPAAKTTASPAIASTSNSKPASKPAPAPVEAKPNGKSTAPEEEEESGSDASGSEEDDSEEESETESSEDEVEIAKARAAKKIEARHKIAEAAKSTEDLRSPICCILGHVDHGKTKLLDKIRQTSVADGEAGGITQQIGATFFPKSAIVEKTAVVNEGQAYDVKIPGLLIIDTPGHESFSNLRSRGSSLCNIAILVVDITQGLEPQTIESINLLKKGKTPFIVALNKIDKIYDWKEVPNAGFRETLNQQNKSARTYFEDGVKRAKLAFAEQGFNAELFDENVNLGRTLSLVPVSAITGEGIPDMLLLLVKLTQERMNSALMYISELACTILEVKVVEGLGTTIDVILSNGVLREGNQIVLCGQDGPIVTNVRALLTPQPMRELRIKSAYVHHKEVKAAQGIKISAPGLEKAIAGARLFVAQDADEVEFYKDLAMQDVNDLQRFAVQKRGEPGVWVQASTLGSLEALLTFLQQMKIPVKNFAIGPLFKSHLLKASRMLEVASEYAVVLAFDVPIDRDAEQYAKDTGVQIFSSMVIYHLFDAFKVYMHDVTEAKKQAAMPHAVWPARLKIIKAFANRDPIVLGVDLIEGVSIRTGTPVGVIKVDKETGKREIVKLGKITGIEINHKPFEIVKKAQIGAGAAIKIERAAHEPAKSYGRHFDDKDEVVSLISRQSIDTLKTSFRDQVDITEWALIKKMKTEQGIP